MIVIKNLESECSRRQMDSYNFLFNVIEKQTSLITILILISAYIPKGGTDYPTMTD